ncbi:MAG TPA: hypothetical protein VEK57_21915 [Thermoanaerobaculia bacterium]|nr:hypothetical protein [Thermoanaerobaculia bacterium]
MFLRLKQLSRDDLAAFVAENLTVLSEEETLGVIENPSVTPQILGKIAQTARLAGFHSVRLRLVGHRQTPQAHAVKLVHYLYWIDLLGLSVDVQVPAPVRRAIDTQLLIRVEKLSLGERISSARRCSLALIKVFLYDPHPKVFESLLVNARLREDELLALISSDRATAEQLRMVAADMKWSFRYAIRRALVLNPLTPPASAATQLKYLSRSDLRRIYANPATTVYVRRCIERMRPDDFSTALRSD